MEYFYQNDVGVELEIDIGIPTNKIIDCKIIAKKPSGNRAVWKAEIIPDSTSIKYVLKEGDINEAGKYKIQPEITLDTGFRGRGEIVTFLVKEGL